MQRPLALHHLSIMDVEAPEAVEIAHAVGCELVCLFAHSPVIPVPGSEFRQFPEVNGANVGEVGARMKDLGVALGNIEFFPVTVDLPLEAYARAFEIGSSLGAGRAVTHIHDPDEQRAVDGLGRLCDLAARFDLKLGLEFMGVTKACNSIQRAAFYVRSVGRPNIGIGMDALHLTRTGGTPQDIARTPAEFFCYAQICDGHGLGGLADYSHETLDREIPGLGDWPVLEMIEAMPMATALDVEVPSRTLQAAGVPPLERSRRAVAQARALVDQAVVTR